MKKVLISFVILLFTLLLCGSASAGTSLTSSSQHDFHQGNGITTSNHIGTYKAPTKIYISYPEVKSANPANNAVNVPLTKVIKVSFNKPIRLETKPWIELKNARWGYKPFTATTTG